MTHDRLYYFLPYWDDKPCMHVRSVWPDLRRRMYNSNVIARIADRLEEGLSEVHGLSEQEDQSAERRLRAVLDDLNCACARYVSLVRQTSAQPGTGKTKLDRERARLCEREIVRSEREERRAIQILVLSGRSLTRFSVLLLTGADGHHGQKPQGTSYKALL